MKELRERLASLGLSQYFEPFVTEGFDSWETVLDVTEADLEHLNVKLGHRRKLQRAIAEARGIASDKALTPTNRRASIDASYRSDDSGPELRESTRSNPTGAAAGSVGTKRKYRRHPKPDENAPERPASAYVIFSNQVREKLKGQDMTFTEIAKIVGEQWQVLESSTRDAVERQAAAAKEKYYAELAQYKKTPQYAQYQEYLAEFKAKHGAPQRGGSTSVSTKSTVESSSAAEGKRPKFELQTSTSTRSSSQGDSFDRQFDPSSIQAAPETMHHLSRSGSSPPSASHYPNYRAYALSASSSSASPATYAQSLHSPNTRGPYSPVSTSPSMVSGMPAYELPHHSRGSNIADMLTRDTGTAVPSPRGLQAGMRSPVEQDQRSLRSVTRRTPAASSTPTTLPPLLHETTSMSSDSGFPPSLPSLPSLSTYSSSSSLLPPLDAPKEERTLPQPIQTSIASLITSTPMTLPRTTLSPGAGPPRQEGQWPALLRATEIARAADLQNRPGPPPPGKDDGQLR